MIVLNHLFEVPATDIHKTEVEKTIFKGEAERFVKYSVEPMGDWKSSADLVNLASGILTCGPPIL